MLGGSWVTFTPAGKLNVGRSSLPEVFSTVDAGETLTVPADVHVFLYLGFFQGFTTAVAGEEHHLNSASARLHSNAKLIRFCLITGSNHEGSDLGLTLWETDRGVHC